MGTVLIQGPSTGVNAALIEVFIDNVSPNDSPIVGSDISSAGVSTVPIFYVATLAAGTHRLDLRILTQGSTYLVFGFDFYAIQLGA
jgi:hypothetical protein